MNPITHFLVSFVLSLLLFKLNIIPFEYALICGIISVLIDIDHYIEYVIHAKSNRFSLKAAWNNSIKLHRFKTRSFIHHWRGAFILTIIFVIILLFNWKISLILALAYYSHLVLDIHHLTKKNLRLKIEGWFWTEPYSEIALDIICILFTIIILAY